MSGLRSTCLLFVLAALLGCSGGKARTSAAVAGPYDKYREALDELIDGDYVQAATAFESLSSSTLNPVISQLAALRLGDALFFQARYAEAAEVYRQFMEQYASSPDAPHAAYMRGLCYLRKMPEDVWIIPPPESREMSDVENAYASFSSLVEAAPQSFYAMRARLMLAQTVERRCEHHLYVAHYYAKQDEPLGVVQRLEQALRYENREREKGYIPEDFHCAGTRENLLLLARSYKTLGNLEGLKRTAERILARKDLATPQTRQQLETMIRKLEKP